MSGLLGVETVEAGVTGVSSIELRRIIDNDLDDLFAWERDPEAVEMAAFTAKDPDNRVSFDTHMSALRTSPDVNFFGIVRDGVLVGIMASFVSNGRPEVTYWVDRAVWGQGIASHALAQLLSSVRVRPIFARAASDNVRSLAVLRSCGFLEIGHESAFAQGRNRQVDETVLRLG